MRSLREPCRVAASALGLSSVPPAAAAFSCLIRVPLVVAGFLAFSSAQPAAASFEIPSLEPSTRSVAASSAASPGPLRYSRFEREESASPWPRIGGQLLAGAVLTGLAYSAEDPELAAIRLEQVDNLSDFDFVGDGYFMAAGIGSVAGYGWLRGSPGARDLSRDLLKAWAITGALVGTIKVSVNRTRPNGGAYSFPSGHTATAFMAAPVLHEHFGWRAGVPAYLIASSVALGRMEDRKHFLSDVVAGAAIGLAAGTYVAFGRSRLWLEAGDRSLALATEW